MSSLYVSYKSWVYFTYHGVNGILLVYGTKRVRIADYIKELWCSLSRCGSSSGVLMSGSWPGNGFLFSRLSPELDTGRMGIC